MHIPRFLVTQEEYNASSQADRRRYNYEVVDDTPMELPTNFRMPVDNQQRTKKPANYNIERLL